MLINLLIFLGLSIRQFRFKLALNVLQLGEVAEIEAQMFSFAQMVNRRTAVEFSTEPAILPNCCCAFGVLARKPPMYII
jgi:hypothetical protein